MPFPTRARTGLLALLMVLVSQLALAGRAQAWWNSDWSYRMRIVADTTSKGANIAGTIGGTQVLVRLHSGNIDFSKLKDDGSDLRFIAGDDRTPLHFQVERFDGLVDQVALVWVDLPALAANQQTPFYVYYGNKNATNGEDPHATWDPSQVLVWHFQEESGNPKDSTGYDNNGLTPVKRDRSGLIGLGATLAADSPVLLPKSASLAFPAAQAATWSMWVKLADGTPRTALLFTEADGANTLTIGLDNGVAYASIATPTGVLRTSPGTALPATGWHLIAVTSGDHLAVSVDGVAQGSVAATLPALAGQGVLGGAATPAAALPGATTPVAPGSAPAAPPAATAPGTTPAAPLAATPAATPAAIPNFSGGIDEFRIAKIAEPLAVEQVAFANEGTDPKLLTFDVAEESSFFGSGYVGIILRSVGLDSWVVIGLLGIMAALSWWVMIGKALFLGRLRRSNAKFRAEYARMLVATGDANESALTGIPESSKRFGGSSLFRLYAIGSHELVVRLHGGLVGEGGMLRAQSIAAIRAAIDAGLVRETTRLNRLMVMLTIAIAGGPFLGLLGTVVGVMITFAAIAQAGDVNVNAIAPGISAALLATVAGLFVAIPALFGYNYLLTQIRDASADMQAFVDELVTRMGEGLHPAQRTLPTRSEEI